MRRSLLVVLLLTQAVPEAVAHTAAQEHPDDQVLRIGVHAFRSTEATFQRWNPTAIHLSRTLPGYRFELMPLFYPELRQAIDRAEVDFVLTHPDEYVIQKLRNELDALATLIVMEGGHPVSQFGGVIFTRADRQDINQLEDLRGRSLLSARDDALGVYLAQQWTLQKAGIAIKRDLPQAQFVGPPQDKTVFGVLAGEADVGFVRTGILEMLAAEGRIELEQLKVLAPSRLAAFPLKLSTDLYPEWPFAVMPHVDSTLRDEVTQSLLQIAQGSPAAKLGQYYGFAPAQDYSAVEALMLRLNIHPASQQLALERLTAPLMKGGLVVLSLLLILGVYLLLRFRTMNRGLLQANVDLQRHQTMLDGLGEGVYCMDLQGRTLFANLAAERLLGFSREELLASQTHELFHHTRSDGTPYPRAECPVYMTLNDGRHRHTEEEFIRKDGSRFPVDLTAEAILEGEEVSSVVVVFSDISERKAAEEHITQLAFYDPLTQLPNRRLLMDRTEAALRLSARQLQYGAVMMIDLDRFKEINDTEGHDFGDTVLQEASRRLLSAVRETDTVGRLGGDEFMVLLAGLGQMRNEAESHAARVADTILQQFRGAHSINGQDYFATASIGIVLFKNHNDTVRQLMKDADIAMYRAKEKGRNRCELYQPPMQP